jgi:glyoxylase-like metal-dependent hydrolase (beta-lactamase superfamily II)
MNIHAITTGHVKITNRWREGHGQGAFRFLRTITDRHFTDWLPIYCYVIEHSSGLIVIDTGIPADANKPVYFPPYIRLIQRAAKFRITAFQEIGPQMRQLGLDPADVRTVILTHLHQDHEGGLHHFPNAEFFVSRTEWDIAQGFTGRLRGYLNSRWPSDFKPTLIDFADSAIGTFPQSQQIVDGLYCLPTPGHSDGHMSILLEDGPQRYLFAGDVAYTEMALMNGILDGVTLDLDLAAQSMQRTRDLVLSAPTIFLPSHDPDVETRLTNHQVAMAT